MDNPETQATMSTQDTGPLEAARIATGLPIFTKTEILYRETGWELLSPRRKRRKLQLFYDIVNKHTPNYLCTLIPPLCNVRQCIR